MLAKSDTLSPAALYERLPGVPLAGMSPLERDIFRLRFQQYLPDALRPLRQLYGEREDFDRQLEHLADIVARSYAERAPELRLLDLRRVGEPDWFQQSKMVGYVCYVDRFAGSLEKVAERIPYLQELGVTYLHLMPLLKPRPGASDGGYAVMDYRQVDPRLGSMADLQRLADRLREHGISLCIDLVCNHTAKEHEWARKAVAGDPVYRDYYLMYPDRTLPDQYEMTLLEVFPEFAPGNFTWYDDCGQWVWTTFNEFQWDLNYENPAVFAEMLDVMLYLANQGVEVLRLDAVAFMWKRLGTDCQNQPEAHLLLQAFRALMRIAAPAVIFKAEAIVSPDRLLPYLGQKLATHKECELAYHNSYMVLLWSSLAEQRVTLLTHALQQMPDTPPGCAWVTYVRCHDDIGWAVRDEDAGAIGLSGVLHRAFLSDFYSGRFPGGFARGATFQFNPRNGDRRISGTLASLAGLELAVENEDWRAVDLAIRRILLMYNLIFAFDGIPLIYMGDELGLLNDHSYRDELDHANDNRWLHRPHMDWKLAERRHDWQSIAGRIFQGLSRLVEARQRTPALHAQAGTYGVWTLNDHVFGLLRTSARGRILVLANFSETVQTVPRHRLYQLAVDGPLHEHLERRQLDGWSDIQLEPYQALWLEKAE